MVTAYFYALRLTSKTQPSVKMWAKFLGGLHKKDRRLVDALDQGCLLTESNVRWLKEHHTEDNFDMEFVGVKYSLEVVPVEEVEA